MPEDERSPTADALTALLEGDVEVVGRLPWSSNRTFLVKCAHAGSEVPAVYKPGRGERPLWDFPPDVYRREVAAWVLSEALGWHVVPPTVERDDAPLGPGSMQLFMPADFSQHHFTLIDDERHHDRLRTICAFDIVANNADRKSGHCILGEDGTIWAIDNGLCFHHHPKLRTVIWEFAGEELPAVLLTGLTRLVRELPLQLSALLSAQEVDATIDRAAALADAGLFPEPDPESHHYPWPLV